MNQKVIVVTESNNRLQDALDKELAKYGNDWKVVSATTAIAPFDPLNHNQAAERSVWPGSAGQIYYATTVIIEPVLIRPVTVNVIR